MARPQQPIAHGTPAGARAHYRRSERPCPACHRAMLADQGARRGHQGAALMPELREIRNGLPEFVPYRYRGLGYDQLEEEAAS